MGEAQQADNHESLKISTSSDPHHFPKTILLGLAAFLIMIIGGGIGYYLATDNSKLSSLQEKNQPLIESTPTPTQSISTIPDSSQVLKPGIYQKTPVTSPDKYGFTKSVDLKGIGVKAKFPQDANVSLQQENFYVAKVGSNDTVTFALKDYDGTGRRAWFQKEYKFYKDYAFSPFNGINHSGYIVYSKTSDDKSPGGYFYFTAINSKKMLVIDGFNIIHGSIFFGGDLERFKSFLSTAKLTTTQNIMIEDFKVSDLYRQSDIRKTVWEDANLGLKISAPEWTESRNAFERDIEGKWIYTDWIRSYPEIETYGSSGEYIKTVRFRGGYDQYLSILSSKYQDKSFSDIANDLLIPAGFCKTEWKKTKSECEDPDADFCYTKEEVVNNLIVKKQIKIGTLDAQLRNMNQDFSYKHDCRSEDTWLIKAKNGQVILTRISPDGQAIRIEAL